MPVYEYECPDCQHFQEIYKKISDANAIEVCVQCLGPMDRLMSCGSFRMYGDGIYNKSKTKFD